MTPARFGPYVVERELGKGGMATVLLVRHEMTGARYALKLLAGPRSDFEAHQRFEREARALATLSGHPFIVSVHAYGFEGGTAWYVMDLVEGQSLDEIVRKRGPISIRAALKVGAQVANALAAAHGQGIIHRDVKPGNIMIVGDLEKSDARALLCDFGLALAAEDDRLTRSGELVGTPAFLAPEQAKNKGQGPPVDIFALGGVLHFALTGRLAHGADAKMWHAVVMAIMKNPAEPLRSVRAEVPEELERIVLRCLEKDPANRFPSAGALEYALLDCLRSGRTVERRRAGTILAVALAAGALGVGLGLRGRMSPVVPGPGIATTVSPTTTDRKDPGHDDGKDWHAWSLDKRLALAERTAKDDPVQAARIAIGVSPRVVEAEDERRQLETFFAKAVHDAAPEVAGTVALVGLRAGLDLGAVKESLGPIAQQALVAKIQSTSPPADGTLRAGLRDCILASIATHAGDGGTFLREEARPKLRVRPDPPKADRPSITDVVDRNAWRLQPLDTGVEPQLANARTYARMHEGAKAREIIESVAVSCPEPLQEALNAARLQLEIVEDPLKALSELAGKEPTQRVKILGAEAEQEAALRTEGDERERHMKAAETRWAELADARESDFTLRTFAYASLVRLEISLHRGPHARAWFTRGVEALDGGFQEFDKLAKEIFGDQR
jgi:serine/threonine protein kinase